MATVKPTSLLLLQILAVSMLATTVAANNCLSGLRSTDVPFDFSSVTCVTVWDKEDYKLAYKKNGTIWSFVLSAPNKDVYVGVGFSETGAMAGSSAVVGWIASGKGFAWQYRLNSYSSVVPNDGDLDLVNGSTTIVLKSNRLYLGFQFKLATGEPLTNIICALGPENFVPVNNILSYHQNRTVYMITYNTSSGNSSSGSPSEGPSGSPSGSPTGSPSESPSGRPTGSPSGSPSGSPTGSPSRSPSISPSGSPSGSPASPGPGGSSGQSLAGKPNHNGFMATFFGSVAVYLAICLL